MRPSAGTRPENRVLEISQITQGLKAIARRGQTAQEVFFTVRIQFDSIRVEPIVMVVVFGGSVSRLCWRCACAVR